VKNMWKWLLFAYMSLAGTAVAETKVLAFSGSSRAISINKMLLAEASSLARQMGASVTVIDLKEYPMALYEGDLEVAKGMPSHAKKLRQLMIQSQVILIASPEHNGSIPALLKNALDWASRSEEGGPAREAFKGKNLAS
jgi:chromate reductase